MVSKVQIEKNVYINKNNNNYLFYLLTFLVILCSLPEGFNGLKCCMCKWEEDKGEQCLCGKQPDKRNCLSDIMERQQSSSIGSTTGSGEPEPESICVIIAEGHVVSTNKTIFGRLEIPRNSIIDSIYVTRTCWLWTNVDQPVQEYPDLYMGKACGCNHDWCNCNGDFSNITKRPDADNCVVSLPCRNVLVLASLILFLQHVFVVSNLPFLNK